MPEVYQTYIIWYHIDSEDCIYCVHYRIHMKFSEFGGVIMGGKLANRTEVSKVAELLLEFDPF